MADDVTIEIGVDASNASKGVRKFSKRAKKSLKSVTDSIFSVKSALIGVSGVLAGRAIIGALNSVTDAASVQEDAINAINTAMKISGEFSADAAAGMQDYASGIQEATKFGDEAILQQLALAKSFGASNEQAQLAVTAAVEFAAATGKSLEEANRQVSKTLGGFAGELGEINPAIKALTSEQLKAGEATRILIEQFGGSAQAQVKTFSGAVAQTSNTFGDFLEEIGGLITKSPVVVKAITSLNKGFQQLIKFINENQVSISKFVGKSIIFLIKGFSQVVKSVSAAVTGISNFIRAALQIQVIGDIVANLGKVFDFLTLGIVSAVESIVSSIENLLIFANDIPGIGGKFDDAIKSVDGFRAALKGTGDLIAKDILSSDKIDTSGIIENLEAISDTSETVGDDISGFVDGIVADLERLQNAPKVVIEAPEIKSKGKDIGSQIAKEIDGFKIGAEIAKGIAAGAGGAKNALVTGLTAGAALAAETFSKGLGDQISPILGPVLATLFSGPEATEAAVEGFVEALPTLLDAFARAIPVLITTLADNVDEIIIALVKATPAIARALAIEVPIALLTVNWGQVAGNLVSAFVEELTGQKNVIFDLDKLKAILADIGKPFRVFSSAVDTLVNFLDNFKFPSIGGGGGSSQLSRAGSAIGLANGGLIPSGFPNDTFAANLSSGELVVPENKVESFTQGNQTDMSETNALLAKLIQSVEAGGGTMEISLSDGLLADKILEMNQRGERLTA